mmetsp:Transcript_14441/g.18932  ORF Transcript_14441/g.18932 Transcript_14441/m.18932 type:complete len:460 (-) Transcript_14441:227-1606(-)
MNIRWMSLNHTPRLCKFLPHHFLFYLKNSKFLFSQERLIFALPSFPTPQFGKAHNEERVIPFPKGQLFDVVADVDRYKEFLPFCVDSRVFPNKTTRTFEAELAVGFRAFTERYISRVTLDPPHSITTRAVNSPTFKRINSKWEFFPGPSPGQTLVKFRVEFEVESLVAAAAVNAFFIEVTNQQVQAFEKRCFQLYGRPSKKEPQVSAEAGEEPEPITKDFANEREKKLEQAKSEIDHAGEVFETHCLIYGSKDQACLPAFESACRELALTYPGFYELSEDSTLVATLYNSLHKFLYHESMRPRPKQFMSQVYAIVQACPEVRARMLFDMMDRNSDGKVTPEGMKRVFQVYLSAISQVIPELVCKKMSTFGGVDADQCSTETWELVQEIMKEVQSEIPEAVSQVFLEVGADPTDGSGITIQDWERAWHLHPDLLEIISIRNMNRLVHWVAAIRSSVSSES